MEAGMDQHYYHTEDRSESRTLITSVRVQASPVHWFLTVWNRGGCAGSLTVNAEDGPAVLDRLLPPAQRSETPAPASPAGLMMAGRA
jgi:hypothetical protein